jgi:hypothetical protein
MSKSFEEQYPDYKLIPEKKRHWVWPLIWVAALTLAVGVPLTGLYLLGQVEVPTPNEAALNGYSIGTLGSIGATQARYGQYALAVRTFSDYFQLGGDDPEHMALFASSLNQVGRSAEGLEWSRKAVQAAPASKTARFINEILEAKTKAAH